MERQVILDLASYELSQEEKEILQHPCMKGIILFSRNYFDKKQLKALTKDIKKQLPNGIIAIDQEGGRVQRLKEGFSSLPPMLFWGQKFEENPELTKRELTTTIKQTCMELKEVGINLNMIPVLDINHGISEIIGERSLHQNSNYVVELAETIINALSSCSMPSVGKHFPGHGAVIADSHLSLPIDTRLKEEIFSIDLKPFQHLATKLDMIMPAHIIYSEIDELPATFSSIWLKQILRNQLNFRGIIISDDLTMKATETIGSYPARAQLALEAGVDLLLICNNLKGSVAVLESLERNYD